MRKKAKWWRPVGCARCLVQIADGFPSPALAVLAKMSERTRSNESIASRFAGFRGAVAVGMNGAVCLTMRESFFPG